jgi:flagellar assembly protein FliH
LSNIIKHGEKSSARKYVLPKLVEASEAIDRGESDGDSKQEQPLSDDEDEEEVRSLNKNLIKAENAGQVKKFDLTPFTGATEAAEERKKKSETMFKPDMAGQKEKEFVLGGFSFEYASGYRSDEIMKKSLDEADAIIKRAADKAHSIEMDAFKKGYDAGHESGRSVAGIEVGSLMSALKDSTDKLISARNDFYAGSEKEMLDLVILVASNLAVKEIKEDRTVIANAIKKAASELQSKQSVVIRLNKADMDIANSIKQELIDEIENIEQVDFSVDSSVNPGGCIVQTNIGMVDATLETRFLHIVRNLKEQLS